MIVDFFKKLFGGTTSDKHPLDGATRKAMEAQAPYKLEPPTLNLNDEASWPFPTAEEKPAPAKIVAKKAPAKKSAPAKKAPAKKSAPAKKAPAKKAPAKKSTSK